MKSPNDKRTCRPDGHRWPWILLWLVCSTILSVLTVSGNGMAGEVTLAWDGNQEPDVAGYKVYCGLNSGNYQFSTDIGAQTQCTVSNLQEGKTYFFAVTAYDGSGNESGFSNEVRHLIQLSVYADFDSNQVPDVLWRDAAGHTVIWYMDASGAVISHARGVPLYCSAGWEVSGVGDFNDDGIPDILWRNAETGANGIWYLGSDGGTVTGISPAPSCTGGWQIGGIGDFDGDLIPDIFWRNSSTGANAVWYLEADGASIKGAGGMPSCGTNWQVAGVADFDGDGVPDVVWRDQSTGANALWRMAEGGTVVAETGALPACNGIWYVGKIADFNADGVPDVFWRNPATGMNAIWYMGGAGNVIADVVVVPACSTIWNIVG